MLTFLDRNGQSFLAITCDECGEPIAHYTDGNFHWQTDASGALLPERRFFTFTHKRCCRQFETRRQAADVAWQAMELNILPALLCESLKLPYKTSRDWLTLLRMNESQARVWHDERRPRR